MTKWAWITKNYGPIVAIVISTSRRNPAFEVKISRFARNDRQLDISLGQCGSAKKRGGKVDAVERIEQIFLQLEFAIKLLIYIELRKINKEDFDCDTTILLQRSNIGFGCNSFNSYDDLILAAQNNYILTLGASAITLETSLQEAGIKNDPNDLSPKGQLRALVYMIRCAFAHDIMTPHWVIKPPYQRVFELDLPNGKVSIDLQKLDGEIFKDEHIGGVETYYEIKDAVRKVIEASRP